MLGPTLRGEKISLEPARPEDGPQRLAWFADLEVTRLYTDPGVPSPNQDAASFERGARDDSMVLWRIALDGKTIGECFLHEIQWIHRQARTGIWIGNRSDWSHGYGSEAVKLRSDFAFRELGLERIETSSMDINIGMHRALEKSGFRRIGKRTRRFHVAGVWRDEFIFELLREGWTGLDAGLARTEPSATSRDGSADNNHP